MTETNHNTCQHDDCTSTETQQYEAYIPATSEYEVLTFCDEHATSAGFCPGCGHMVAGNEWDDLHRIRFGICAECVQELNDELGMYDEDNSYLY